MDAVPLAILPIFTIHPPMSRDYLFTLGGSCLSHTLPRALRASHHDNQL